MYAIDIPGEPGVSEEVRYDMKGPVYVKWMLDIYAALGVEKASLAGISMGGWFALKFAAAHPERVEKLALLCPGGVVAPRLSFTFGLIPLMLLGEKGLRLGMQRVYGSDSVPEEALRVSSLIAVNFNPRMSIPIFDNETLQRVINPTLLIVGEKDALLPAHRLARRLQKLLPRCKAEVLASRGHVLINLSEKVIGFLKE